MSAISLFYYEEKYFFMCKIISGDDHFDRGCCGPIHFAKT